MASFLENVEKLCNRSLKHRSKKKKKQRTKHKRILKFRDSKGDKKRKVFPNDNAALKVVYLATQPASKNWTMPIKNWKRALNRFVIEFEEQLAPHLYTPKISTSSWTAPADF